MTTPAEPFDPAFTVSARFSLRFKHLLASGQGPSVAADIIYIAY